MDRRTLLALLPAAALARLAVGPARAEGIDPNAILNDPEAPVSGNPKGDLTIVVIPGGIVFAPGSVRLRAEVDPVLDLLSTALNLHPALPIFVIGHTDDEVVQGRLKKQFPTNWELSAARAAAVCTALSSEWGVSPARFTAAGRGEWHPIADNATAEGREANRRVEVVIHPAEDKA